MRILVGVGIIVMLVVLGGAGYWLVSNLFVQDPNEAIVDQFFQQNGLGQSGEQLSGDLGSGGVQGSGDIVSPDSFNELIDMFSGENMSGTTSPTNNSTDISLDTSTQMSLQQLQQLSKEQLQQRRLQDYKNYRAELLGTGTQQENSQQSSTVQTTPTVEEEFTIDRINE